VGQRVNAGAGQKRLRGKVAFEPDRSFTVYRSSVNDLISRQLKKLVMEINGTTKVDLELAIDKAVSEAGARQETPDLRAVVDDVFAAATESRSRSIAHTESSRAIHDSTVMAAESSGVVKGFKPIISADACEVCMGHEGEFTSLDAAKRQIGEYEGRGLPPWHPNDRCAVEEVLDEEAY
jgi:prophage DNA circulation protein